LPNIDDPGFTERIRSGDSRAIESVVKAYLAQILRAARGAGLDETRAEDVTQATFMTFVEKAKTFDGRSHVRTWLFGILYKKILETRREIKRDTGRDDIDEVVEQRFSSKGTWVRPPRPIDLELHQSQIRDWIHECLEPIPLRQQMAFVLREVESFTH
jgi:RNA polymerase sigma-70 factor (ECF subfamily)